MRRLLLPALSLAVLAAAGVASLLWQPGTADVYQRLEQRLDTLARLLPGRIGEGEPRLYVINGQTVGVELERADTTPARAIQAAARLLAGQRRKAGRSEAPTPQARTYAGDGWSALVLFAAVEADQLPRPEWVVLAVEEPGADVTRVWSLRFAADLDLAGLIGDPPPAALAAVPMQGIVPWPGAAPVFQLSEYSEHGEGHLLVYEGDGSVAAHRQHFARSLGQGSGNAAFELAPGSPAGAGVLQFTDAGREIAVYSDPGGVAGSASSVAAGTVLDLIQIRVLR